MRKRVMGIWTSHNTLQEVGESKNRKKYSVLKVIYLNIILYLLVNLRLIIYHQVSTSVSKLYFI